MKDDYLWKVRCSESGYFVGECGCPYCWDDLELDLDDLDPYFQTSDEVWEEWQEEEDEFYD